MEPGPATTGRRDLADLETAGDSSTRARRCASPGRGGVLTSTPGNARGERGVLAHFTHQLAQPGLTRGNGVGPGCPVPLPHHGRRLGSPRAAPGLGAEAGALHRLRARRRGAVARPGPGRVAAGVPRHLRDRAAQPGPADPLRDPERARRRRRRAVLRPVDRPRGGAAAARACRCSRSTPTVRPASSTCWPSTCRPSSSTRTSSTASTWPACPVRAADRRAEHPLVGAGGHCTYNPEPLADFLDFVVLGDGEEVVGEITEVVGAWKRRRPRRGPRATCCATLGRHRGRLRARRCTRPRYDGPTARLEVTAPIDPDVPGRGREAHHRRPRPTGRTRSSQLVPLTEVVHDRLNVEVFRGLHPRLPLLPGRHDHPPGARAPGRAGRARWSSEGLRRTGYDEVALTILSTADFSRHRGRRRATVMDDSRRLRQRVGEPAEPAGRRLHRRHRRPDPEGPPHRPHLRPRGRHLAHAPGDQQAHHRGRPLRRGRLGLSARAGGA